jgi:hypothetical protein
MDALKQFKEGQRQNWANSAPLEAQTTPTAAQLIKLVPALGVKHLCATIERSAGPVLRAVEFLSATDPAKLAEFRREAEALVAEYFEDNVVHQDYLMTRAEKI